MVRVEKVEYKPVGVRALLIEMKDLSELMIDLAYSAALFDSPALAEEVMEMESRIDTITYLLNMNVMVAARDAEDAESLVGVTKVARATDKISDAAADIASIVLQGIGIHPIIREAFEKVEEQLTRVEVKPKSILAGRQLGGLELAAKMGVDIIAIRRNKRWIINPEENETIQEGDVLIVRGAPQGIKEIEGIAKGTIQKLED
ncbi:MAG: potassium channel protein [Candidatus Bathyarchaeota archaeon]|nr:potassium channel protein [Candidatus Bathyarchaeota archaeon]